MVRPATTLETDLVRNVTLAEYTTLGLGGKAKYFYECATVEQIHSALDFAKREGLRVHVLGGGSNTIFSDKGFDGLVLKIALRGVQFIHNRDHVNTVAAAGEEWDSFIELCIQNNLAGLECLSGIPGLVGATPIQNVGAYGQEVAETIISVRAIDRRTFVEVEFTRDECIFSYRRSRFNGEDLDRFIILEVTFELRLFGEPQIKYPELRKTIDSTVKLDSLAPGSEKLQAVRSAVLSLRKRKSMVLDPADPNSRSVGSFFKNPVLSRDEFGTFEARYRAAGITRTVPTFPAGDSTKIPAAWLVENAGFGKGYRENGVGISSNHSLALVNYNGTTAELLALAQKIQSAVESKFGIQLEREPVVIQ